MSRALSSSSARAKQNRLPASYYRGGTSRAVIFAQHDLPSSRSKWDRIFLSVIGGNDPNGRQLDGMGGGVSSLSKVCVVGKTKEDDEEADVDYTFAAIGVKNDEVDYSSNCGNMTSAIGPFAVDRGLVDVKDNGETTVRIRNTNTNKIIHSTFLVADDEAEATGDFAIDGVSGTAGRIKLAFVDPAGSRTGKLLPTGNVIDTLAGIPATCIDAGNPCVFVAAGSLAVDGTTLPEALENDTDLLGRLEEIRQEASVAMGLSKTKSQTAGSVPKIAIVSPSTSHRVLSGETITAEEIDLVIRALSVGQPHRAVPITVAMATAAAANIKGTTVAQVTSRTRVDSEGVTVGHSSGKLLVGSEFDEHGHLKKATVFRTARRLMEGSIFWK